ncbi:MAG: transcriptional repressor [Peptococcaceae bacterium]|nr:transcriptional repressor [Peptococcaceae bacterium]
MRKKREFGDALRLSGLRNTRQRSAILEILGQSDQPLAAEQVFTELINKGIAVNLSTVYRTLDIFSAKNLATKLNITGENRTLFEYNKDVHRHYLICLGCKEIVPIKNCPLKGYEKSLAEETNYAIAGHKLDVYGYCPKCNQNREGQEEDE